MNNYSEYVDYKSVELQKLTCGLEIKIAREIVSEKDSYIGYRIRAYVWSQDAGKKVEFKYPADWWQAFKERFFKGWLLKKYPVSYTHKVFEVKATYPELNVQSHKPVLRLIQYDFSDDSRFTK